MNGITNLGQSSGIRGTEQVGTKNPNQPEIGQNVGNVLIKEEEGKKHDVPTPSNTKDAQNVGSMQKTEEPQKQTGNFGGFSFRNAQGSSGDMGGGSSVGGADLMQRI